MLGREKEGKQTRSCPHHLVISGRPVCLWNVNISEVWHASPLLASSCVGRISVT